LVGVLISFLHLNNYFGSYFGREDGKFEFIKKYLISYGNFLFVE